MMNEKRSNRVQALDGVEDSPPPPKGAVTPAVIKDAKTLIGGLKFGQLVANTGTISSSKTCRIDRQPASAGAANIQVQINGIPGPSTVATCTIDDEVFNSIAKWPSGLQEHQQNWLMRQIRAALNRSLDDGKIYSIVGSFADPDNPRELTPRKRRNYRRSQ